jgi:hypothetical protein
MVSISRPDRTTEARLLSLGQVIAVVGMGQIGKYYTDIDTSDQYGTWHYQFGSQGPFATFERKSFTVRAAINP